MHFISVRFDVLFKLLNVTKTIVIFLAHQDCGVGFLTTLGVCPTPDVQLDYFLNHTLMMGISVEMVKF